MERLTVDNPSLIGYEEFDSIYLRLKRYEDLQKQGRLLELPCVVGDTV